MGAGVCLDRGGQAPQAGSQGLSLCLTTASSTRRPSSCFETMMHMLYWTCFVYDYKRVGSAMPHTFLGIGLHCLLVLFILRNFWTTFWQFMQTHRPSCTARSGINTVMSLDTGTKSALPLLPSCSAPPPPPPAPPTLFLSFLPALFQPAHDALSSPLRFPGPSGEVSSLRVPLATTSLLLTLLLAPPPLPSIPLPPTPAATKSQCGFSFQLPE